MSRLLDTLPPLPRRVRALPVDARGYPVPWFVAWLGPDGTWLERGQGKPDFRLAYPTAISTAVSSGLCWICGQKRGALHAFVAGPVTAVSRVHAEPPCHPTCAEFAAMACPFLVNPNRKRREQGMPEGVIPMDERASMRNPGVTLVWATRTFRPFIEPGGVLFELGDPEFVKWFAEGRQATRAEVAASIMDGVPTLAEEASREPGGLTALAAAMEAAYTFLPEEPSE